MNPWDYVTRFSESPLGQNLMTANRVIGQGVGLLGDEASRAADDYFNNTIPGQLTKNTWNAASYLMQAPQQAVFGFGKNGSDAFGKINNYLQDKGMDNLPATFLSALGSVPAGLYGANKAALFSGRGNNIRGEQLADGLFENPKYDKVAGVGLDFFADPWGAASIPLSQKIGTAARTTKNLLKARTENIPAYEDIKETIGIPKAIASLDISDPGTHRMSDDIWKFHGNPKEKWDKMVDDTSLLPMAIRVDAPNIHGTMEQMGSVVPQTGVTTGQSRGGHTIINAIRRPKWQAEDTWGHETLHNTAGMLPDKIRGQLSRHIEGVLASEQPEILNTVKEVYAPIYRSRLGDMLGEEGLAHSIYNYGMSVPLDDDIITLLDYTNRRRMRINTDPAMPLPLDPASINRARVAYDEWK